MNRRGFLERAAQLLALGIAGDQLELVERLTWRRRFFPSAAIPSTAITPGYYTPSFLFWAVEPGAYSVVFDPLSRSLSVPGYTVDDRGRVRDGAGTIVAYVNPSPKFNLVGEGHYRVSPGPVRVAEVILRGERR
jgi:hypothetical protein